MKEMLVPTPHGKVAVVDYGGDGPDLLLMHGSGRTLGDWARIRPLVNGRRIVAMDFRWHGFSSDEGEANLEAFADDAEAVVEELQLSNPAVAGHSLGGMVAAVYGSRHSACPGAANFDGHGNGTFEQYDGISHERLELFRADLRNVQLRWTNSAWSGDDAWRHAFLTAIRAQAAAAGLSQQILDEVLSRVTVHDAPGMWRRRPAKQYMERAATLWDSLRMFDIYRACQCPLLIYNCVKPEAFPHPDFEEIMTAYRRGLGKDLARLAAEQPNIRIRTLQTGHDMLGEEAQVAADLMALSR